MKPPNGPEKTRELEAVIDIWVPGDPHIGLQSRGQSCGSSGYLQNCEHQNKIFTFLLNGIAQHKKPVKMSTDAWESS